MSSGITTSQPGSPYLETLSDVTGGKKEIYSPFQEGAARSTLFSEHVDTLSSEGVTLLHSAVENRDYAQVLFLLQKGANPNALSSANRTPLYHAATSGSWDLFRLLEEWGGDRAICDSAGLSPLNHAYCKGLEIPADLSLSSYDLAYNAAKTIGHSFDRRGVVQIGSQFVPLEVSYERQMLFPLARACEALITRGGHTLDRSCLEKVSAALSLAAKPSLSKSEVVDAISRGELVIVPAGWANHTITLVFFNHCLVISNRGDTLTGKKCIEAFHIEPDQVTEELLTTIANNGEEDSLGGKSWFYKVLPKLLLPSSTREPSKRWKTDQYEQIKLPRQHAGTCGYASPLGAIQFAYWALRGTIPASSKQAEIETLAARLQEMVWETSWPDLNDYPDAAYSGPLMEIAGELDLRMDAI